MSRCILPSSRRHDEPRGRLDVAPRQRRCGPPPLIDRSEAEGVSLAELARVAGKGGR